MAQFIGKCCVQVVDSEPIIHIGIQSLLPADRFLVVSSVLTAADAVGDSKRMAIDLVILGLNLLDRPGEWVLDYYKKARPGLPVLIYSGDREAHHSEHYVRRGAVGFVCKTTDKNTLLAALEAIQSGRRPYCGPLPLNTVESHAIEDVVLTQREAQIAAMIADGLGSDAISLKLGISKETVKKHRAGVMKKIDAKRSTQIAAYIWKAKALGAQNLAKDD